MTKSDWKKILIASGVSVFAGIIVLIVVLARKRKKLSKKKLKQLVEEDLAVWQGKKETDATVLPLVQWYWNLIGKSFSVATLQTSSHRNTYPWSAAYISALMKRWGLGDRFPYSASHSTYIVDSIKNRTSPTGSAFYGFRINEQPVEVGDLVAVDRGFGINYDNVYEGAKTHTDLVYDIKKTENGYTAYTVGGNIGDSVKVREVPLDSNKRITDGKYFAVLKNSAV